MVQWNLDIMNLDIKDKVLFVMGNFLCPSYSKIYEKEPCYKKTLLSRTVSPSP